MTGVVKGKIKVRQLRDWAARFDGDQELELVMDCFSGRAYLKTPKKGGWERIDLGDGSVQGMVTGRMSTATTSIQELDRGDKRFVPGGRDWEVWAEGYAATGESGGATLLGHAIARTFREACDKVAGELSDPKLYNSKQLTYWGCRLYDNEADARKAFG